jgi:hypothetical protein
LPFSTQNWWSYCVYWIWGGGKIKECVKEREYHPLYHDLEISR